MSEDLKEYEEIKCYFSPSEWEKLSHDEIIEMKNEKWKYDTIRRCGWTTKPPLFMARNPHRKRQQQQPRQQETPLGPLGEGATFPSETRSCLGEPVAPDEALAHPPPSAPSPDQPDEGAALGPRSEARIIPEPSIPSVTEPRVTERTPRYPKRGRSWKTQAESVVFENDGLLFCDDCQVEWEGDCPLHGPLLVIPDTEVAVGRPDRALLTVPPQLAVLVSKIPGAGLGVWTRQAVPRRVRFGPYEGDTVPADQETGYGWEICRAGKPTHCVDALDMTSSNWLRFVNCARHSGEQNLFPYQYKGKLYYRTTHDIPANTELLVWYGDSYAKDLGVDPEAYEDPAQLDQRALTGTFPCERCNLCFVSPLLLAQHHRCGACSAEIRRRRACAAPGGVVGGELGDGAAAASGGGDQGAAVPDKPHRCETCGAAFKREGDLQRHIRTHTAGAFSCERCNLCFVSPLLLAQHHRCGACPAEIKRRRTCAAPGGVVGGELGDGIAAAAAAGEDHGAAVPDKPHRCETCAAAFKRKGDLQRHIRTHTGERPHSCQTCSAAFARRSNLEVHMRTHTGKKPFCCQTCGAAFAESATLKFHMSTHTGEKPYTCEACGAAFAHTSKLQRHIRTHTGEKPHSCQTCGAGFAQRCNLLKHMRTHTGEKPYSCQTCGAGFSQRSDLLNHMRTHTGDRPHTCQTCGAAFAQSRCLKQHMRTHTGEKPYSCQTCGASFAESGDLRRHMRTHTGEKPYSCQTCGAGFSLSCNLRKHMRTHTGERPYTCQTCGAAFARGFNLRTHMRTHTG